MHSKRGISNYTVVGVPLLIYAGHRLTSRKFESQKLSKIFLEVAGKSKEMVRLERETSNSFGADLFETLEDWEAYLKAEHIDYDNLSPSTTVDVLSETHANKADVGTPTHPCVKPSIQRLEP